MFNKNPFSEFRATQQQVQEDVDKSKYPLKNPMKTYKVKHPKYNGKIDAESHEDAVKKLRAKGLKGIISVTQEDTQTESLDPVNKNAVKKKFDDRKDKDIDNDGDVDSSDKFLHKKRKAISKNIKKDAKNGGKEGDVEMNPKMEKETTQKESRIRTALKSVLVEKENHSPNQDKAEKMKDNRKGKGAEDMMAPADDAVANPAIDEPDRMKKDAAKMTSNVKVAAKRKGDNPQGDTNIKPAGTPMKDPAAMKAESYDKMTGLKAAYASMYDQKKSLNEEKYGSEHIKKATDGKFDTLAKFHTHMMKHHEIHAAQHAKEGGDHSLASSMHKSAAAEHKKALTLTKSHGDGAKYQKQSVSAHEKTISAMEETDDAGDFKKVKNPKNLSKLETHDDFKQG
jgi:hypothetical protein